ncbi:ectonucleotide pyrophosphatase/phosphodiesterase [Gracilimonas sediminicola]|uniref:Ectonucleotide pyrophosphatase/phosphodiesterase n=1 Tax=Gracilimonas sediminicola TaxID=2952158 RepID=A0A9X2RGL3_9BACT|nr:ectonucleotide pyrophosphatase/phosphodiesterase [Gracilimonas sediminicola]MCP9291029.1 ectonucleotide pyrophosphatase/phosphodiesterase [Gracilimonas sediminicola]
MKKILVCALISMSLMGCIEEEKSRDTKVLLVSFDGFRHDYLSKTDTPNFDKLVETGVLSEGLIPIFPSKTFPNYYAMATGLHPENNGFIANNMYDPEMDARFTISNRDAVENPDWYEGEPIWNTVEKAGKKSGTMFWVGSETPIQDMRPTHWKRYNESMPDSARIDTVVKWLSYGNEKEVDFATLYFSFVDARGHRFGPNSPEVVEAIERADNLVGYLVESINQKELSGKTNLMIVSDHGMAEISRDRVVILNEMINPDNLEVISYSPAMMANAKAGKLNEVYLALKANEEHFKVYKKEDIPERYHLKNHRRVPELLLVADVGYTITTREFFEERENYPSGGNHGFDNQAKEMHALFVANGPDFRKGYTAKPFKNVHLYSLMAHLLEITPAQNDGSLDSVSVLLK